MRFIERRLMPSLQRALQRGRSILLLGPRQTGKSTLLARLSPDLSLSFLLPGVRLRYERDPDRLTREIESLAQSLRRKPLIVLDEVQRWPDCMDVAQDAIDRGLAQLILTGSSARKLRRGKQVNLLPGRVVVLRMDPLTPFELPKRPLEDWLLDGGLPGIIAGAGNDREEDLNAYVETYLDEEVRAEALVRNVAVFSRFLQLAAAESGRLMNVSRLAQDVGVSPTTLRAYFDILEDCLLAERIAPFAVTSSRGRLVKSPKYLFFDLGVRRRCADAPRTLTRELCGSLFEQFIGLELQRSLRLSTPRARLSFWRDHDGPEVDWVVEVQGAVVAVEVKWTDAPTVRDARHLRTFADRYPATRHAFVVCRCPRPQKLGPNVTALPWQQLQRVIEAL